MSINNFEEFAVFMAGGNSKPGNTGNSENGPSPAANSGQDLSASSAFVRPEATSSATPHSSSQTSPLSTDLGSTSTPASFKDFKAAAMAHPSRITGSCLCGGVKYELAGCPVIRVLCHCGNCRKVTGSVFMANSVFTKEQLKILDGESHLGTFLDTKTNSGRALQRRFCQKCGSPMFISSDEVGEMANIVSVTTGSMDVDHQSFEKDGWQPDQEFFCSSRQRWLPKFDNTIKSD